MTIFKSIHPTHYARIASCLISVTFLFYCEPLAAKPKEAPKVKIAIIQTEPSPEIHAELPRVKGIAHYAWEVTKRTSIRLNLKPDIISLTDTKLFSYPVLFLFGSKPIEFSDQGLSNLRQHLKMGGLLFIDETGGNDPKFRASIVRLIQKLYPGKQLQEVSREHVIFKSFYLLNNHSGRKMNKDYLEAVAVDGRLSILVSTNDIFGAYGRNNYGGWAFEIRNEMARELTFRFGINLIMYALCLDYKDDQVHIPFILERRK